MSFDKLSADEKIKKPFIKIEVTPQPHFIPGYTGFCPDLSQVIGASYARATNEILKKKPEIAGRLSPVELSVDNPEKAHKVRLSELDKDKRLINSRFPNEGRKILNDYMMPGYCGHVPNISDAVGVSYTKGCVKSIAKFIREREEEENGRFSIM